MGMASVEENWIYVFRYVVLYVIFDVILHKAELVSCIRYRTCYHITCIFFVG